MSSKERTQFAVIGMGRFGIALATNLFEMNKDVLAIDINEEKINALSNSVTHALAADATDENVLKSIGIRNFDVVIICIGTNMQASILSALLCKQLGVKQVVAKAQSPAHKKVLEKIGADTVIFPEEYMGKRLAKMLAYPNLNDMLELNDGFKLIDIKTPRRWVGHTLQGLDLRKQYNVSVISIKREDGTVTITPGGDSVLHAGDSIMIGGESTIIDKISNKFASDEP